MKLRRRIITMSLAAFLLAGCTGNETKDTAKVEETKKIEAEVSKEETEVEKVEESTETEKTDETKNEEESKVEEKEEIKEEKKPTIEDVDLSLKPNELGKVMVLMYHGIDEKESTWVRTPENFRRDLKVLYEKGYRPVSIADFVNNDIDVEAGFTPVVLTFDDGNQNNFNIIVDEAGNKTVDPNCAVGILEEFNKEHPDFPLEATFFLNGQNPFRQPELIDYKLNYLLEKGFDVGNHTMGHNDMSNKSMTIEKMQQYIGGQASFIEQYTKDYKVNTYALCNGGRPKNDALKSYLQKGVYEGNDYENIAIFNVGWDPSISPAHVKFDPFAIHRIRASEMNVDNVGMYNWLEHFDKHPNQRFVSDGFKDIITIKKSDSEKLNKEKLADKIIYEYEN